MIGWLSRKNLAGRPGRTAALSLLAMLLSLSIFGGSLMIQSLQRGLTGLEARLGADIIVVPDEAKSKFNVNDILTQGNPGYFYMDREKLDRIAERPGVAAVSSQLYLASMSAGCCSLKVQIVGFDPATDFTIQPWIQETFHGEIGDGDIVVGSDIDIPTDGVLTFFDVPCRVVARLSRTGSSLDQSVYANRETTERLIAASQAKGMNKYNDIDPEAVVSTVLVRIAEGNDIEAVKNDINLHVRRVTAVRASSMISGIAENLTGITRLIGGCVAAVWALCVGILMAAFTLIVNERKKEFAILRVLGASRRKLAGEVLLEALGVSLLGAAPGVALGALALIPFSRAIQGALGLPFVAPSGGRVAALAGGSLAACALAGGLVSALSAARISRVDTSAILREGN